jgi:hypothetical protein
MRIYVSSTFSDLTEHREAVKKVIGSLEEINFEYAGVEYLSADTRPSVEVLLREIIDSTFFVLLIGWRYGYVPEGHGKSLVEMEYDTAVENKVPILCYMIDPNYPFPPKFVDTGRNAEKLKRFKERITQDRVVRYFGSPEDLAQKLTVDLTTWGSKSLRESNEDIVIRPLLEQELHRYKEENSIYISTIDSLRKRMENIVPAEPIWTTRNFAIDTTFCFVLLPFKEQFFRIYEEAMLPAINDAGLRGLHAGEIFDNREIVEDIWESICTAKLVVADVTGRNPNVFYELGICHTLGKEVIVLTQSSIDVPFDIRHRRFIEYEPDKLVSLKTKLERTVKQVLLRS